MGPVRGLEFAGPCFRGSGECPSRSAPGRVAGGVPLLVVSARCVQRPPPRPLLARASRGDLDCASFQRTPVVYCVRLARALVDDYCCLVPGSVQTLKQILSASPRFCCQFITSVTALYDLSSGKGRSGRCRSEELPLSTGSISTDKHPVTVSVFGPFSL